MSAKAEITRMRVTEYDEKETLALEREEGREEGRAEGLEEGREVGRVEGRVEERIEALKAAVKNLYNQGYPVEKIASAFDASVVDVKIWLNDVE